MAKKVYYSFHYKPDNWRVQQVQKMGVLEGQPLLSAQKWEEVKGKGDDAIEQWIDDEMTGKSCLVVLIGNQTAGRPWVKYEIKKSWDEKRGVVGVYIHNLKNKDGFQASKGKNPFDAFTVGTAKKSMSSIVTAWNSSYSTSTNVYDDIKNNLPDLVDKAIEIRKNFTG